MDEARGQEMLKFMIHSCNSRLWYVSNFLIPSLKEQGITESDIVLWNDYNSDGNLMSFVNSAYWVKNNFPVNCGTWHLQDDVLISSTFADRVRRMPNNMICNGYRTKTNVPDSMDSIGFQSVDKYWNSFQCVYIPNAYMNEFTRWFHEEIIVKQRCPKKLSENKHDDYFFWKYVKEVHPNHTIYNAVPCLVQHVYEIIGGSEANKCKKARNVARYWDEEDREKQLAKQIKQFLMEESIADGKTRNRD